MNAISHTVVLSTPKTTIPQTNIIQFIKTLIQTNQVKLEYFGGQEDPAIDAHHEEILAEITTTTFLTIHFNQEGIMNYGLLEEDIFQMLLNKLDGSFEQLIVDEKDIEIYC